MHTYSLLALGDSYTIGEAVLLIESFPYQTIQLLRKKQLNFFAPEIIAKTGWTTDELQAAMQHYRFLPKYDFVTLLIGVNNQFRGRNVVEYKEQFEELLKQAIQLANGKNERVITVSIPDYSVTPFAANLRTTKIAREIEVFNGVNKALSIQYRTQYIDITKMSAKQMSAIDMLAEDQLHPSQKLYALWADKLAENIAASLK